MGTKRIMVCMPSGLLDEVDIVVKAEGRNRSEILREAMRMYLKARASMDLRERLREGYRQMAALNLAIAREDEVHLLSGSLAYEAYLSDGERLGD